MKKSEVSQTDSLVNLAIEGIYNKLGKQVVTIDLQGIENAICRYFIICHGESTTQTSAIAESIEEVIRKKGKEKPLHREGFKNANWILLDYGDMIVHVFLESYRGLYNLEELWADGKIAYVKE